MNKFKEYEMSTRSTIWIKNENGGYDGVYCHSDGYLTAVGATLLTNYDTVDKINELISKGSLSSLGSYVGEKCNPDYSQRNYKEFQVCCFDHRDGGESLHIFHALNELDILNYEEEFTYIFKDGKWYFKDGLFIRELTSDAILESWSGTGYIDKGFATKCLSKMLNK